MSLAVGLAVRVRAKISPLALCDTSVFGGTYTTVKLV